MAKSCRLIIPYYRHEFTFLTGETLESLIAARAAAAARTSQEGYSDDFEIEPDNQDYLTSLNVLEWKDQDHYRVLGLSNARYRASFDLIRKAYVQKARRYHPDKKGAQQSTPAELELDENSDSFKCIMKAYELLSDPVKRRSFDSVDPMFDNEVPTGSTPSKFFETFGPVFERNAHFSVKQPVPLLGDANSSREQVEQFYDFWNEFDSWREFSYLDEEDTERAENRFERRQIDQSNKKARKERKKEETIRIRRLVDTANANDPRVQRFREEERQRRAAEKQARFDAKRQREAEQEEIRRNAEAAERAERERIEAERQEVEAEQRRQREAAKKNIKKERKTFRDFAKAAEFFFLAESPDSLDAAVSKVKRLEQVDQFADCAPVEFLKEFNERYTAEFGQNAQADAGNTELLRRKCAVFEEHFRRYEATIEEERARQIEAAKARSKNEAAEKQKRLDANNEVWTFEQVQSLIKACSLYPVGSKNRWDLVADYVNAHVRTKSGVRVTPQSALVKAKEALRNEQNVRSMADQHRLAQLENDLRGRNVLDVTEISERYDAGASAAANKSAPEPVAPESAASEPSTKPSANSSASSNWSAEEQKRLEEALRKVPGKDDAKWQAVAELVGTRTKEECVRRYKQLCEMVKAKKAQAGAASTRQN